MSTTSTTFPRIQSSQLDGRAEPFRYRQAQLHRLYESLIEAASTIKLAIQTDSFLTSTEVDFEFARALSELRTHYESLDFQRDLKAVHQIETGVENVQNAKPVGIVYIVPSRWTLTFSVLSALGAAVAAGSCVVVELPETLTQTSAVLRKVLTGALDADTFAIAKSRPRPDFTRKCMLVNQTEEVVEPNEWLHVLSSPAASRAVAVVDRTADLEQAALAITEASFGFQGRSAYAPQAVLVNEFVAESLISRVVAIVVERSAGHRMKTQANGVNGQPREDRRTANSSANVGNINTVVAGSYGTVVELVDRTTSPLSAKPGERTIVVCRISSLDDALNVLKGHTLAACFLFAGLKEANYLSRFTTAYMYTINHIPIELFIGPVAPAHLYHPSSPSPRYSAGMFKTPAPQYLPPPKRTETPHSTVSPGDQALVGKMLDKALQPLPPIVQRSGRQLNFFGQAIFLGLGMALTTIVGVSAGGVWLVFGRSHGKWWH